MDNLRKKWSRWTKLWSRFQSRTPVAASSISIHIYNRWKSFTSSTEHQRKSVVELSIGITASVSCWNPFHFPPVITILKIPKSWRTVRYYEGCLQSTDEEPGSAY